MNSTLYTGAFTLSPQAGVQTVKARIYRTGVNPSATATAAYTVNSVNVTTQPQVYIASPADGAELTAPTMITGNVVSTALAYWRLDYQSVGGNNWVRFASGVSTVTADDIVKFDPTMLQNGQYNIRLTAVDKQGHSVADIITVVVKGGLKVGPFMVSFNDMTLPFDGIPITITRSYDSRDKTNGDFGVGWKLSTTSVKVQKPQVSAYNWSQTYSGNTYQLIPMRPHIITITLPGDDTYDFAETVNPFYQGFYPLDMTTVVYQQVSGHKATLTPVGVNPYVYIGAIVNSSDPNAGNSQAVEFYQDVDLNEIYNPTEFILTLHNGTKFDVTTSGKILSITDRNGNKLTFTDNSITTSAGGGGVDINHTNNVITSIMNKAYNGNGPSLKYQYDGNGNLIAVTDRVGNTTQFQYDANHNLIAVIDPRGIQAAGNAYLPDGRLKSTTDAKGNTVHYYYDKKNLCPYSDDPNHPYITKVPDYSEVIIDRMGYPTLTTYDSYGNVTLKRHWLDANTSVSTSYAFGDSNNPDKETKITDPMGYVTDMTYSATGDLLTTTRYLINADGSKWDHNILISIEAPALWLSRG